MKRRHSSARAMALFTYISVLILSLSACDEEGHSSKSGKLRLSLTADTTSLKKGIDSGITKAVSDEFTQFLTTEDYRILIVTDKDTTKSYDRFDQMPSEIELPEGAYTLVASKGNNLPAEFENPYFEGSTAFTVKEGMSTPLEVTATLGNARITAEYTDDFKEAYSDYTVLLSSSYTTADLEIVKGETRPAYMQVDKDGTNIAIGIKLKKITEETEKTYYVPTALKLERRQNVRLVFKTDGEALDGIGLDIVLDDTMEEVTMTTEIPDFMWKPFKEPTLTAIEFADGDEFEFRSGLFEENPYIGINMAGGIGSLNIKYWKDGEDEEDATIYNLATDAGVKAAKENHYTWTVGEETDVNMSKKKASVLYLKEGLNSLPSSDKDSYIYHYKIYGTDATGKAKESNVITFDAKVLPAEAPQIIAKPDDEKFEIVEGDELAADWMLSFTATGLIDEEQTKVVVNDGTSNVEYAFMSEAGREALKQALGVETEITNSANAVLAFPKSFTTLLKAPETGSKDYTFTFYLKDKKNKEDKLTKIVTVHVPELTLETTENDAFAKRIVLRAKLAEQANVKHLSFQYKSVSSSWLSVTSSGLKPDGDAVDGFVQYVDTLKGLEASSLYSVRAVYNLNSSYERFTDSKDLMTEKMQGFSNGKLIDPLEDWSIKPDNNQSTLPGYDTEIKFAIADLTSSVGPLAEPYRCWEIWQLASDWNTLNELTTSSGETKNDGIKIGDATGNKKWTRYVANSGTIKSDAGFSGNAALIRTVGWGIGSAAAFDLGFTQIGAKVENSTPGELYLGSYNGGAQYGIPFTSRPTGFAFYYKYENLMKSSDTFTAEIVVKDEKENDIVVKTFTSSEVTSDWKRQVVYLDYKQGAAKAGTMFIRFVSGQAGDYGVSDFPVKPNAQNVSNGEYTGSNLYIDNVELIYE
ncbi:DUF4493 domain-containing protein [Parabacteroides chongii]|uniref:DUF4493 domain-containing protein n=1 Tax=Parabacteroides chongii TaxID=2685834 RepID=UPI00240D1F25|nr:DUF4493 domain-containing protein [Parabacteroides chongii]WFE86365.1 DUF4493 domain-containing protein [Parabacteroides chongii]